MIRSILIGATCATIGGTVVAGANVSHIVGKGGEQVPLTEKCTRAVVPAPGETLAFSVNVIGQQVHCLIRRPDPFARCVKRLGAAPVVAKGHTHPDGTSDWSNVDKVAKYLGKVSDCADSQLSGR